MSVLCLLTGSSQHLSVAASGYWYLLSGCLSFAFWPVQANVCLLLLPVTGTYQVDVCPSPSDRFKLTSVHCCFRFLVPTKGMSVLCHLTGSSEIFSITTSGYWYPPSRGLSFAFWPVQVRVCLSPLLVADTHQANVCPCLPTSPSQCLSFAFQLPQANVCPPPVPSDRYLPTGTLQLVPLQPVHLWPVLFDWYPPTGTLQPVLSDWYIPTGILSPLLFSTFQVSSRYLLLLVPFHPEHTTFMV